MALDAALAIVHHLAAFALVALLFVEFALVHHPMGGAGIRRFGRIDALYGLAAMTVVIAGIARLIWGAVPAEVYLTNLFFWTKMGALGVVAVISIAPTVRGSRWRKGLALDPGYVAPDEDLVVARRALWIELLVLPLIPVSAALMARGFGDL
jgi:putative membrane protein